VDDDLEAREALSELLTSQGAEVVAFADELALCSAVAKRPPTAILLDIVLHWVDGLRLCRELKRHAATRTAPVYVMSGIDRPHLRQGALKAGAQAFLPKPLRLEQLLALMAPAPPPRMEEPRTPLWLRAETR
jgi:DNA-binding response OmpR family regulator